jgi:hypothetical protein
MKRVKPAVLLAMSALTVLGFSSQANLDPQIKGYYTLQDSLTLKKDGPGLEKLMTGHATPDFMNVGKPDKTGKARTKTMAEDMAQMKQTLPFIDKFTKVHSMIKKVAAGKGSVVVTVSTDVAMQTKKGPDGKVHSVDGHDVNEDTWVKSGGRWKMKISKTVSETMKIDGKAFGGM